MTSDREAADTLLLKSHNPFVLLLSVALCLIMIGSRYWLIDHYGSDLPFWDQWDAEWNTLFRPYLDGTLSVNDLLAPHNEHRVLLSRLLSLGLLSINGQWDSSLQMVVNSTFYSIVGATLFYILGKELKPALMLVWALVITLLFSMPFGWENSIAGFQSQFYFLAAFSLASIWLLTHSAAWSQRWWAGVILGFLSLFTMASGVMAPIAICIGLAVTMLRQKQDLKVTFYRSVPTVALCLVVIGAGALLMVRVEGHAVYQAHSVKDFITALLTCLAWPLQTKIWAIFNWAPFAAFILIYLKQDNQPGKREQFLLVAGIWVLLQIAATSFSRSTIVSSSRYADMYAYGIMINFLVLLAFAPARLRSSKGIFFVLFFGIWIAGNWIGLYSGSFNGAATSRKTIYDVQKFRTAGYLSTRDFQFLIPQMKQDIPYPNPEIFARYVEDTKIQPILATSVRPAMRMTSPGDSPRFLAADFDPEILSPYPWERLWQFPPGGDTEYSFSKSTNLPYLFFFIRGDAKNLSVTDSEGKNLTVSTIPGQAGMWKEAYVRSPNPTIHFVSTGKDTAIFSQPKEMGRFSLWAKLLSRKSRFILNAGIALCGLAALLFTLKLYSIKTEPVLASEHGVVND